MKNSAISPIRNENYSEWYQAVIQAAELAEFAQVRGCMVIRPWGYALWENMQKILDQAIKKTGHQNIYCPLFIPLSLMQKEADHVAGFATECAIVTHTRLTQDTNGSLVPSSPLDEPLVVRPTSETVIGELFAKWIQSYRDLPLLINQWANVVRWEMRTRLFLRTSEFLWQEGHTAHETEEEANQHAITMLKVYKDFCTNTLAIPVYVGTKSENETFPGAEKTYTLEGIMQDGKALQLGTSHFLGQKFSTAANMQFQDRQGNTQIPWTTSWGITTRLIGGLIMTHADDNGLVLPPAIAHTQVMIIPILGKQGQHDDILNYCINLKQAISQLNFRDQNITVDLDNSDFNSGEKNWRWIKKGVPIRLFVGLKEYHERTVCYALRNHDPKTRHHESFDDLKTKLPGILEHMQESLLTQAETERYTQIKLCTNRDSIVEHFNKNHTPIFVYWKEDELQETWLKEQFNATVRCFPHDHNYHDYPLHGPSLLDQQKQAPLALVAKAY
ncbi:MAG: proline--tRNA ligase [Pseudomonadota bacterium]|nr:proline--tRNA ligase [Pseudomonadota bacterium]